MVCGFPLEGCHFEPVKLFGSISKGISSLTYPVHPGIQTNHTFFRNAPSKFNISSFSFLLQLLPTAWSHLKVCQLQANSRKMPLKCVLYSFLVTINCGRVEISLKKEVAHQQWEEIGTYLKGHAQLTQKNKRGMYGICGVGKSGEV